MRNVFDQAREPAATDMENEMREMAHAYEFFGIQMKFVINYQHFQLLQYDSIREHVGNCLIPLIHVELQRIAQDQKAAFDGALSAVRLILSSSMRFKEKLMLL